MIGGAAVTVSARPAHQTVGFFERLLSHWRLAIQRARAWSRSPMHPHVTLVGRTLKETGQMYAKLRGEPLCETRSMMAGGPRLGGKPLEGPCETRS